MDANDYMNQLLRWTINIILFIVAMLQQFIKRNIFAEFHMCNLERLFIWAYRLVKQVCDQ